MTRAPAATKKGITVCPSAPDPPAISTTLPSALILPSIARSSRVSPATVVDPPCDRKRGQAAFPITCQLHGASSRHEKVVHPHFRSHTPLGVNPFTHAGVDEGADHLPRIEVVREPELDFAHLVEAFHLCRIQFQVKTRQVVLELAELPGTDDRNDRLGLFSQPRECHLSRRAPHLLGDSDDLLCNRS